jgi:RHS repeat-associated protein
MSHEIPTTQTTHSNHAEGSEEFLQINNRRHSINNQDSQSREGSRNMKNNTKTTLGKILAFCEKTRIEQMKSINQKLSFENLNDLKSLQQTRKRFLVQNRYLAFGNFLLLMLTMMSLLQTAAFGQTQTARPDRGMNNTGSYQASNIDAVNMLNGNVTLKVPLASLPPIAGGKLSYTLNAYYNSKLLNLNRRETKVGTGEPGCPQSFTVEEPMTADNGGWRLEGGYRLFFRDAHEDYDYSNDLNETCDGNEYYFMQGKFFKPMIRMPDGSEHELRINSANNPIYTGDREYLKNYYKYTGTNNEPTFDAPTKMYSIDNTFLSAVVNPPTDPVKWTIYLKDGTQIIQYANNEQRIKDTNGNSILMSNGSIKDEQTGREIKTSQTTYNGQTATKVEYQTVGGSWQQVLVVWGSITVTGKIYQTNEWDQDGGSFENVCKVHKAMGQETIPVIREILLPATESGIAGQKFSFAYNSDTSAQATTQNVLWTCNNSDTPESYTRTASTGLGELSEVTMPTGAKIKYSYAWNGRHNFENALGDELNELVRNVITSKNIEHDSITETWAYNLETSDFTGQGSVINPDGSTLTETFLPTNTSFPASFGSGSGEAGLSVGTNQSNKIITQRKWKPLGGTTYTFGSVSRIVGVNPVVDTEYTTLLDDSGNRVKTRASKYEYDYNGELLQTIEYDWYTPQTDQFAIPSDATVLRTVNNIYYNQALDNSLSNYYPNRAVGASTVILGAPQETTVGNSQTRFSYDGQSYGTAPVKGNVTQVSNWDSSSNAWINTSSTYDTYGNVTSTTDPKGNVTQILYEDATHAMPTKTIVDPQNGTGQQISTATYDFSTGAPLSKTDINGNVSNFDYTNHLLGAVDPFGRPGTVLSPATSINGTNKRQTSKTYYEDSIRKVRTEADLFDEGDGLLKSRSTSDQLGRTVLSEKNENGASTYSISSQTIYKDMGKIVLQSNPTRNASESTDGWTRVTNDNLGRSIEIATFSGSIQPPWTGTNSNSTGTVLTSYDTNATTVTDQAGKQRRWITNGLGQLARVDEPDDSGNLGTVSTPNQATSYSYDILGNLTQVNQGVQTRTFTYNSLARLMTANNPESGTISYGYDANGNLTSKTDARNVVTSYTYDAFNRVLTRSYSDGTPTVNYTYENTGIAYSKGKLTKVSTTIPGTSSLLETKYTGFDNLGRVLASEQVTDGQTFGFAYQYNLSGALVSKTYPSGRVVTNQFEADGDLSQVNGQLSGTNKNYAGGFSYNAMGAVSSMQLGNGRWENAQFNSRLQPTQLGLGTSSNDQSLWKVNYDYGTTDNNGNVKGQTITVPSINPLIQTFTYDSLNRIKSAKEETSNNPQTWKQTFQYDRYGNRTFDVNQTTTIPTGCSAAQCNPTVDTANNRFTSGQGYSYDNSGNVISDAQGRTFVYDAENKQKTVSGSGGTIGQYLYDGDGKRVKKVSSVETTLFVYDASGNLATEYLLTSSTPTTPVTSYLTIDTLRSPRIITDQSGNVISRRDFMPFGEEISSLGGRISTLGYQSDSARQKFTSYERDNESELDYAKARMHNYKLGRFTSPDPFNIVFEKQLEKDTDKGNRQFRNYISKPEQWNRYVYAINNPLKFVDPDGREIRINSSLTEKERNEILYHLQKLTRDKLNWQTDSKGNVNIVITKTNGGGTDAGTRLIRRLDGYKSVVTITTSSGGNSTSYDNVTNASNGVGSNSTVTFNPNATPKIGTLDENTGISRSQDRPVWIGLAHELIHADHAARGTRLLGTATYTYKDTNGRLQTATENRRELATVGIGGQNNRMDITENDIRREQRLRVRSEY